jgi:Domain of unknown function (DUF4291)
MIETDTYEAQRARWPRSGRHILAQHDAETIVVYQAYNRAIAQTAATTGRFGPPWSRARMSWIKPGFLWMMYRSGWATKENQEAILAVWLRRSGFEEILREAVHSSNVPEAYATREAWQAEVSRSDVRLQWDPDHDPSGAKEERRALQLGLRGRALARFADEWIVGIEDITPFVASQRELAHKGEYHQLVIPSETIYPVEDVALAARLRIGA